MSQLSKEKKGTFLRVSVSDVCNFACQYCATDLGMENHTPKCLKAPLLRAHEYVNNMKLLARYGFETISFTGGEPFLARGIAVNHRLRVGCDSYNCIWNGVVVNIKDSISCTHRNAMCENCSEYCQEGIYSLKHSASGWISTCPSNNPELGSLLVVENSDEIIRNYIDIINDITRVDHTGEKFFIRNDLQDQLVIGKEVMGDESDTAFTEGRSKNVS